MMRLPATTRWLSALALGAGLLTLFALTAPHAQPTGGDIMTDVTLTGSAACTTVRVSFSFPVRYLSHFPQGQGTELRIALKPLAAAPADRLSLLGREAYSPAGAATPLASVTYEGDSTGGPSLNLQFSARMYFDVAQGSDFRSMVIFFGEAPRSCAVPPP